MKLKCTIKGNEYNIVQGAHFSDEYNETLDSGTIIIDHVEQISDLKPYDDVYIYEADKTFEGYKYKKMINQYDESGNSNFAVLLNNNSIKFKVSSYFQQILKKQENVQSKVIIALKIKIFNNDTYLQETFENHIEEFTFYNGKMIPSKNNCIFMSDSNFLTSEVTFLFSALNDSYTIERIKSFYNIQNNLEFNQFAILEAFVQNFYYLYYDFSIQQQGFYKHLLVDQFTEERLNPIENIFKYKIELFSETKRLETIVLPNKSITEPLNINKKISIWDYMKNYIEEYSPKIKLNIGYVNPLVFNSDNTYILWDYVPKYSLDPELKSVFENTYSPDFSLNLPNLRDILTRLMQVKDMIPYVKDDVIYGLNITERRGIFDVTQNNITSITSTLTSDNFCNNLKTTYSNALSNEGSSHTIEHIGFRNSDGSLLTLNNLRLETRYPIYKINRILMCYYKKITVLGENGSKECVFLCKQDITPFVQLETSRNLLSQDWSELREKLTDETTIKTIDITELANYKLMTVGYSIGSNYITGWGQKYEEVELDNEQGIPYWWKFNKTYIQNILYFCDKRYPLGVDNKYTLSYNNSYYFYSQNNDYNILDSDKIISADSNDQITQKLKSLFFEIDYTAFYNGAVIHSKDQIMDDGITINDNSSSSLIILEQEGTYQKSKVNRFGNKVYNISMRYNDNNYSNVERLGYVYQENIKYNNLEHLGEDDIIIYHQDYSIFDNYILANYTGSKSAVLKNYFHSVFAKHRTWNIMPYGESVSRAENERIILLLSKNNIFYENNLDNIEFLNFKSDIPILGFFNFFESSNISSFKGQKINDRPFAAITIPDPSDEKKRLMFLSDFNCFVSGNSLCLNAKMNDNFSSGVYIKNLDPTPSLIVFTTEEVKDDYVGSLQSYHVIVDDIETGNIEKMGFVFGKFKTNSEQTNMWINASNSAQRFISEFYKKNIFKLPQLNLLYDNTYCSGLQIAEKDKVFKKHFYDVISLEKNINKDNKEIIDMTLQIEAFSENDDIIISPWLLKLSDFYGQYNKIFENYYVEDYQSYNNVYNLTLENDIGPLSFIEKSGESTGKAAVYPYLQIKIQNSYLSSLSGANVKFKESDYLVFSYEFTNSQFLRENFSGWTNKKSYFYVTDLHFATISQGKIDYIDVTCVPQYVEGKINALGRWSKQEKGGPKGQPFNIRFNLVVNNFNNPETQDGCNLYRAYSLEKITSASPYNTIEHQMIVDSEEAVIDLKCPYSLTHDERFAGSFVDNIWQTQNDFLKIQSKDFVVNNNIPIYYPYPQNMFIGVYEHKIDKNFIYNSYKNWENLSIVKSAKVDNILYLEQNEQGIPYIKLNLQDESLDLVEKMKYKSIVFWYYENPDSLSDYYKQENIDNFSTYTATQNVTTEQNSQQKWTTTITVFYNNAQQVGHEFSAKEISLIKHVNIKTTINSLIIENLSYLPNNAGFQFTVWSNSSFSQVSYCVTYNMGQERLINGSYHFVLGLNVTEQDWSNGEIKIYYSTLKNKNLNIYDLYNRVEGKIYNYSKTTKQNLIVPEQKLSIGEPIEIVKRLDAPIVEKNDNILFWTAIDGAKKYHIFKNNSLIAETDYTTFNASNYLTNIYELESLNPENNSLLAKTTFNVQAISGDLTINNSKLSNFVVFSTQIFKIKEHLDDYTWEEIRAISDFIETLNNSKKTILEFLSEVLNISIGDTKTAIVSTLYEEAEYHFRLIDILHDKNNSNKPIGMTFEMVESFANKRSIDTSNMSNDNIIYTEGKHVYGYPYSTLKTYIETKITLKDPATGDHLNTDQQTLLKHPVKKCLVATKNIFGEEYELQDHISENGLWIASMMELTGEDIGEYIANSEYDFIGKEGAQYLYYQDARIYGAKAFAGIKDRDYNCWLRTISPYAVSTSNRYQNNAANKKYYLMVKPFPALINPIDKQNSTENEDISFALYFCI